MCPLTQLQSQALTPVRQWPCQAELAIAQRQCLNTRATTPSAALHSLTSRPVRALSHAHTPAQRQAHRRILNSAPRPFPARPKRPVASNWPNPSTRHVRRVVVRASGEGGDRKKGRSFSDQLLDYIEGGPKLRRWYGAADEMPRDGTMPGEDGGEGAEAEEEEEEEEEEGDADAVLVTDGDSETGQMVVLSLILKRRRIRALVKDVLIAANEFGPYVEPIAGSVTDEAAVKKALRGVGTVIVTGRAGLVPEGAVGRRVQHIVLLSQVGVERPPSGPFAILGASARESAKKDEAAVAASGVPHTIIRTGQIRDEPSGAGVQLGQGDELRGSLAREDAAAVCVAAVEAGASRASRLIFEVVNSASGASNDDEIAQEIGKLSAAAEAAAAPAS